MSSTSPAKRPNTSSHLELLKDEMIKALQEDGFFKPDAPTAKGALVFKNVVKGTPRVTSILLPTGELLYTTCSPGHHTNLEPLRVLTKCLAPESVAFGLVKVLVELRELEAIIRSPDRVELLCNNKACNKDILNEAIADEFLLQQMRANLPKLLANIDKELKDNEAKYAADPIHGVLPQLRELSTAEFETTNPLEFFEEVYRPSRILVANIASNMHPMLCKQGLSSSVLWFAVADQWERNDFNLWVVALVRLWLLHHNEHILALFWALSAFAPRQAECSPSFQGANAKNAWALVVPVQAKAFGALCEAAKDEAKLDEVLGDLRSSAPRHLERSNAFVLKMLKDEINNVATVDDHCAAAKEYLKPLLEDFDGCNFLVPHALSDDTRRALDEHLSSQEACLSFVEEVYASLRASSE
jgi:hypothetical protein